MASFFLRGFRNKNAKSSSQSCRLYSRGMCMAWTSKCLKKIHTTSKRRNDETPEGETPTGVRFNNLAWQ